MLPPAPALIPLQVLGWQVGLQFSWMTLEVAWIMKIHTKLILGFLLVSLVPLIGTSTLSYWNTRKALTQKILNQLDSISAIQEHRVKTLIEKDLEKLALVSSRTQLRHALGNFIKDAKRSASSQQGVSPGLTLREQDKMNQILLDAKSSVSSLREISVLTLDGTIVASTNRTAIGTNHSREDFFIRGRTGNTVDNFFLDENQNLKINSSGPLSLNKKLLGVIFIESDANNFVSLFQDYSGLGKTGESAITKKNANGDTLTLNPLRFDPQAALHRVTPKDKLSAPMTYALHKREERLLTNAIDYRGKSVLAATRYVPEMDWGLVTKIDRAEAFAPIYELQNSLLLTIIASSTGVLLISLYTARSLIRPVASLTQIAGKISSGDLSQRVDVITKDEIGTLSQTFNQMADSLLEARVGLEQQVEARTAELTRSKEALRHAYDDLEILVARRTEELRESNQVCQAEIEERQRAETVLQQSEEQLRRFIQLCPIGAAMFDRNMRYLFVSDRWLADYGAGRQSLTGLSHYEVLADQPEHWKATHRRCLAGAVETCEADPFPHTDGNLSWLRWAVYPWRDSSGEVGGIIIFSEDITERKQAEEVLHRAHDQLETQIQERTQELAAVNQRLQSTLDNISDGVIVADKGGAFLLVNPAAAQILSVGPTTTTSDQWSQEYGLYLPDTVTPYPAEELPLAQAIQGTSVNETEIFVKHSNKSIGTWTSASARPLKDARGEIIGGILVIRDITQRKQAETDLLESEARFRQLSEATFEAVAISEKGRVLATNKVFPELFGYEPAQVIGMSAMEFVVPECRELVRQKVTLGEENPYEVLCLRQDGTTFPTEIQGKMMFSRGHRVRVTAFRDITERKQAEVKLQTYAAELEAVNQELEQFNYIAAHDLKTPLRTIATRMEIVAKQVGPLSDGVRHHMSRITLAARRMDQLLSDLNAHSQIGRQTGHLVPTDSQAAVQQALDSLVQTIQASSAIIEVEPRSQTVLANPSQLTQVFYHLISNSLKFCHVTPHIKISATCSQNECTFCVADNGIGIPAESREQIFKVFGRLHSQEMYEGTGIGLATVVRILNWHGGRIWVESPEGRGSQFFFTLRKVNYAKAEVKGTDRNSAR